MTGSVDQRAYEAAYAELVAAGFESDRAAPITEWVIESLRETDQLHGVPELLRLAGSEDACYAWALAFGLWSHHRLDPPAVLAATQAAARVLGEAS